MSRALASGRQPAFFLALTPLCLPPGGEMGSGGCMCCSTLLLIVWFLTFCLPGRVCRELDRRARQESHCLVVSRCSLLLLKFPCQYWRCCQDCRALSSHSCLFSVAVLAAQRRGFDVPYRSHVCMNHLTWESKWDGDRGIQISLLLSLCSDLSGGAVRIP